MDREGCHLHSISLSPYLLYYSPSTYSPFFSLTQRRYSYFQRHGHTTICMPASWRSSTGDDPLDEIRALAGTDRMTIPPPLLEALAACETPLPVRWLKCGGQRQFKLCLGK